MDLKVIQETEKKVPWEELQLALQKRKQRTL